jgi:DNA-binding GntR family transcriptional regulator
VLLTYVEQTIEAVMSSDVEEEAFGFPEPRSCLLLKRKTDSTNGPMAE